MSIAAKGATTRDLSRIGWIDYLLMTFGSCLAGYAGGMAINEPGIAWFVVQWTLIGAGVSYLIRRLFLGSKILKIDGFLYGLGVLASFAFRSDLQRIMPAGGFPFELLAAGWLCWMLIFGSFSTWQDSTLLFQAVPSIAIFGLVGVYDTFRDAVFFFFAFLMLLATLFARAHHREMLRQAAKSGYFTRGLAPGSPIPEVETTPGLALKMQEGPWRWMAGPQWALGSAFVVVLISLLGAPVIQQSTQGVAGFVKLPNPPPRNRTQAPSPTMQRMAATEMKIGNGKIQLTDRPVFEATIPEAMYLRTNSFQRYVGGVWLDLNRHLIQNEPSPRDTTYAEMNSSEVEPERVDFSIILRQPIPALPYPGELVGLSLAQGSRPSEVSDGSYDLTSGMFREFAGSAAVISSAKEPTDAVKDIPPVFADSLARVANTRVAELARQVAGEGTDYERANRIMREIASRIKYNTNVDAVPSGEDPVEYTLFEKHEGYCDVFASAMTLMARAAGIPARYAVGYYPDENRRFQGNRFLVVEADSHAWSELYFEGYGWVVFDPTSIAEEVPGGERGSVTDTTPWYAKPWFKTLLDSVAVLLGGVAIFFGLRTLNTGRQARTPRTDLDRVYLGFTRQLERAAKQRRNPGTTPDEFLDLASPHLAGVESQAREINRKLVVAMFGPGEITDQRVRELSQEVKSFSRRLAEARKKR